MDLNGAGGAVAGIATKTSLPSPHRPVMADEIELFGFRLHPRTAEEVVSEIADAVTNRQRLIMANANMHAFAVMFESKGMARLLMQPDTMVMIDSMPMLLFAKLKGYRLTRAKRTTSLDFYHDMFRLGVERQWTFAYVGATEPTLQNGLAALRARYPMLRIEGRSGYFEIGSDQMSADEEGIADWLRALSPDIVIAGMGMPRQEEWIARVQDHVDARVFLTAGAYLDYQVGVQRPSPRWLGQIGFEWLYRLARSPRRLGYRYLIEPMIFAGRLLFCEHPQAERRR